MQNLGYGDCEYMFRVKICVFNCLLLRMFSARGVVAPSDDIHEDIAQRLFRKCLTRPSQCPSNHDVLRIYTALVLHKFLLWLNHNVIKGALMFGEACCTNRTCAFWLFWGVWGRSHSSNQTLFSCIINLLIYCKLYFIISDKPCRILNLDMNYWWLIFNGHICEHGIKDT